MNNKYIATARLGEGVAYVLPEAMADVAGRRVHAGWIIKQSTETNVDLWVRLADGTELGLVTNVEMDPMEARPGSWAPHPKT